MEITILSDEENPMLHRRDVRFRLSHVEATPDRLAIRDSLAARLNKDADEVVIRRLDTKFGMRTTIGEAKVYEAAEFAKDVEQEHMLTRNKIAAGAGGTVVEQEVEEADAEPAAEEESEEAETEDEVEAEESEEVADEEPEEAEAEAEEPEEVADEEPEEAEAEDEEPEEVADEEPEEAEVEDEEPAEAEDEETEE